MFSIGQFARFGSVTVRTIRYYEEVDLLLPAEVDPRTSYRSYGAHQLPRLHRIVALKDLGLSLEQIRPLLDELSVEVLQEMLCMKRAELEERMAKEQALLSRIEHRLRLIQQEEPMAIDVVLKTLPALRVAAIRCDEPGLDFYTMMPFVRTALRELHSRLTAAGVQRHGSLFVFYDDHPDGSLVPSVAADVGGQSVPVDDLVSKTTLPAVEMASTIFDGPATHDFVGPIFGELARWAEDHGYRVNGSGRDHIVGRSATEGNRVLELQLPVERT